MGEIDSHSQSIILGARKSRIPCPFCGPTRRNKRAECLSLSRKMEGILYNCWHCGESGIVRHYPQKSPAWRMETYVEARKSHQPVGMRSPQPSPMIGIDHLPPHSSPPVEQKPLRLTYTDLTPAAIQWLKGRGISEESAAALMLRSTFFWSPQLKQETEGVAFPYNLGYKIRALKSKDFTIDGTVDGMFAAICPDYTGIPVITEGEMDAISFYEAGISAYSLPHGAINPGSDGGNKLNCLASIEEHIGDGVIIATDNDPPGHATKEEIARRYGKEICSVVAWPASIKDANDLLKIDGPGAIRSAVEGAQPYPIEGLYDVGHFASKVEELYISGLGRGLTTGFRCVDELYTVQPGQLTIVTGIPSSGKSEFVDALAVNLAEKFGWKFVVASFENPAPTHIAKLCSKREKKPFWSGPTKRMNEHELKRSIEWVSDHFYFIHDETEDLADFDRIIERVKAAVMRYGVKGFFCDPWNSLSRPSQRDMSETQFASEVLAKLAALAKNLGIHIWLVAHPAKQMKGPDGKIAVPKGYDISGSAHFFNRADVGITVHRPDPINSFDVEIHVWKCRFSWIGKQGVATLTYHPPSATYTEEVPAQRHYADIDL